MRYLTKSYMISALNRGKAVEQFIGEIVREGIGGLRFIQLNRSEEGFIISAYDIEDIGSEDYIDVYSFPTIIEDEYYDIPTHHEDSLDGALAFCEKTYSANPERWVNEGVVQDEYLDDIKVKKS